MRKLPFILAVSMLLAACGPKPGTLGQPCLEGGACSTDLLACGADGLCQRCGRLKLAAR
jgi:hypothetical protein